MPLWLKEQRLAGELHLLICEGLVVVIPHRDLTAEIVSYLEPAYRPDEKGTWILGVSGYSCDDCPVKEQCDDIP